MTTNKNIQNRQENNRSDQNLEGNNSRHSSIFSRHDDVCFYDQADQYQNTRKD